VKSPKAIHLLVLCRTLDEAQSALEMTRDLLSRLKLRLFLEKTIISSIQEDFDFPSPTFGFPVLFNAKNKMINPGETMLFGF